MSWLGHVLGLESSPFGFGGIKLRKPLHEGKWRPGYYSQELALKHGGPSTITTATAGGAINRGGRVSGSAVRTAAAQRAIATPGSVNPQRIIARPIPPPPPHVIAQLRPARVPPSVHAGTLHGFGATPGAYVPNATVWVSRDPQQLFWLSPRDLRNNPSVLDAALMASSDGSSPNVVTLPDGTAVNGASGVAVDPTLLANKYEPTANYLQAARFGEEWLNSIRQPIMWPDGTPMVGHVWLPKMDMRQLGNPEFADFDRSIEVPWYDAHFADGLQATMDAVIRDQNHTEFLKLWPRYPGYRYLGTNYGDELGNVNPLAPWRAINPDHMPPGAAIDPSVLQSNFGPVAVFSTSQWHRSKSIWDLGGDVHRDTYTIHCSFDWSTADPTTQAYPWLYDVFGPGDSAHRGLVAWDTQPADIWRSDGQSVSVGTPNALPVPPFPFNCLEFQTAIMTGDHGVPKCVDASGALNVGALEAAFDNIPGWDALRKSWHHGPAFMMATIYDRDSGAAQTAFDPSLVAGSVIFQRPQIQSAPQIPSAPQAPAPSSPPAPPGAPSGTTANPDGSITAPDGTVLPAGTSANSDGTFTLPDGSSYPPASSAAAPASPSSPPVSATPLGPPSANTDGSITAPDGVVLPPGTIANSDGTFTLPDGSSYPPSDGGYAPAPPSGYAPAPPSWPAPSYGPPSYAPPPAPSGFTLNDDGSVTTADGTTLYPDGTMILANGTVVPPASAGASDGSYTITLNDNGSATLPDGSIVWPDPSTGILTLPDGSQIAPDGTQLN